MGKAKVIKQETTEQVSILAGQLVNWHEEWRLFKGNKTDADNAKETGKTLFKSRVAKMFAYVGQEEKLLDELELFMLSWTDTSKKRNSFQASIGKCWMEITKHDNIQYTIKFPADRDSKKTDDYRPVFHRVTAKTDKTKIDEILSVAKPVVSANSLVTLRKIISGMMTAYAKAQKEKADAKAQKTADAKVLSAEYQLYLTGIEKEHYETACKNARTTLEELKRDGVQVEITATSIEQLARKMMQI